MDKYPDIRVECQALDVSDYDTVFQVFDAFADDFGSIERVVVNAGIGDSRRMICIFLKSFLRNFAKCTSRVAAVKANRYSRFDRKTRVVHFAFLGIL